MDINTVNSNYVNTLSQDQGSRTSQTGTIGRRTVKQIGDSNPIQDTRMKDEFTDRLRFGDGKTLEERSLSLMDDFVVLEKDVFDWADDIAQDLKARTGAELSSGQKAEIVGAFAERISASKDENVKYLVSGRTVGALKAAKNDASERVDVRQLLHGKYKKDEEDYVEDYARLFDFCDRRADAHDAILSAFAYSNARHLERNLVLDVLKDCAAGIRELNSFDEKDLMPFLSPFVKRLATEYVKARSASVDDDGGYEKAKKDLDEAEKTGAVEEQIENLKMKALRAKLKFDRWEIMKDADGQVRVARFLIRSLRAKMPKFDQLMKNCTRADIAETRRLGDFYDEERIQAVVAEGPMMAAQALWRENPDLPRETVFQLSLVNIDKFGNEIPDIMEKVKNQVDLVNYYNTTVLPRQAKSAFTARLCNEMFEIMKNETGLTGQEYKEVKRLGEVKRP